MQLGHLIRQITGLHSVLLDDRVQPLNLHVQLVDHIVTHNDSLVTLGYHFLFVNDLLSQGLELEVFVGKNALQLTNLFREVFLVPIENLLSLGLLLLSRRFNRLIQFDGRLFG